MWTEEQAKKLLTLCCRTDPYNGEFLADELMKSQTLGNLETFGTRLREADRKHGISDEKPEGLVWPEPKLVIPEGFDACSSCDKPTKYECDGCGEPICLKGECSRETESGTFLCDCCYDDEGFF